MAVAHLFTCLSGATATRLAHGVPDFPAAGVPDFPARMSVNFARAHAQASIPSRSASVLILFGGRKPGGSDQPSDRIRVRKEENHDGRLRSGVPRGGRNITQVWMDLRRAPPPRREANHDGRLRSGVPRGGVTHPRSGWFCAGPDPLWERRITTAGCDTE